MSGQNIGREFYYRNYKELAIMISLPVMSVLLSFHAYNVYKKSCSKADDSSDDTEESMTPWWVWSALVAMLLSTALLWLPTWWLRKLNLQREVMLAAWGVWVILITLTLWKVTTFTQD